MTFSFHVPNNDDALTVQARTITHLIIHLT